MYNDDNRVKQEVEEARNSNTNNVHKPSVANIRKNYANNLIGRLPLGNRLNKDNKNNELGNKLARRPLFNKRGLANNNGGTPSPNKDGLDKNDGLDKKDGLNEKNNPLDSSNEEEERKKDNFIKKKTQSIKDKVSDKQKAKIKQKIIKKVVIAITPFLIYAALTFLVLIVIFSFILIPGAYITNKMNVVLNDVNSGLSPEDQISMEECEACYNSLDSKDVDDYLTQDYELSDDIDYTKAYDIFYGKDLENSNSYSGNRYYPDSGDYVDWRQGDSKWSGASLGNSTDYTIGSAGCAMTSVAIQIKRSGTLINLPEQYGDFNPGSFNAWGADHGGFVGADIVWNACYTSGLTPNFHFVNQVRFKSGATYEKKVNEVINLLNQGYYVVLEVGTRQHWVAVTDYKLSVPGYEGPRLYMIDPAGRSATSNDIGEVYWKLQYSDLYSYYAKED